MQTKEQMLEKAKNDRCGELETHFNNMIGMGFDVLYGEGRTQTMHVAGGREALFSLESFYNYYSANNIDQCFIRDPFSKIVYIDTRENMRLMINEVRDWGVEAYIKNIKKQCYVKNQCTTVEQVADVTWESTEINPVPEE